MKKYLCGNEMDLMPGWAFRTMKVFFKIFYFLKPVDNYIDTFQIKPGDTVVDYGCGPGDYIKYVAGLVGNKGFVYAVDIHPLAVESVQKLMNNYSLSNVRAVLADGNSMAIDDHSADLIYAIDMFHMVKDTKSFLKELNRIVKPGGRLIIEDGHQPRSLSREKILSSGLWLLEEENKRNLVCKPVVV